LRGLIGYDCKSGQGKGENWLSRAFSCSPLCLFTFAALVRYNARLCWTSFGNESVALRNQRVPQPVELVGVETIAVGFAFIFDKDN